ncbi:translocon-associated protein subunit beta [Cimex lectularius]|uniref:Translocon-associated protein subunit beta n=1 Tax=Cimex lectularius TaxID=79782 RepID=A0A8I6S1J7_CIMLE|nr:translocon-associated protein subunit beta [Cimex lectularius]
MEFRFYILFALLGCALAAEEGDTGARLLISKQILNNYIVEDMDLIVKYTLYNIGNNAASNIVLSDNSFSPDIFGTAGGHLNVKISRIPPATNITHVVVLKPKRVGMVNFTSAEVRYTNSDESNEVQVGISSEPGEGYVIAFRDYDKKFSPHLIDWGAFAVMAFAPLFIPFVLWRSSKTKYESSLYQKKLKE